MRIKILEGHLGHVQSPAARKRGDSLAPFIRHPSTMLVEVHFEVVVARLAHRHEHARHVRNLKVASRLPPSVVGQVELGLAMVGDPVTSSADEVAALS